MLKELIGYLDLPDNDYWYDSACSVARDIIDRNPDDIFHAILNEWKSWPMERQEHLGYILGEGDSNIELALINELLKSQYDDVVYRAREGQIDFNQRT